MLICLKKTLPLFWMLAFACKKTESPVTDMQLSQMPIKGGDSWTYLVTNYPATQTDTAVYRIDTAYSVFGGEVTYYTYTFVHGVAVDSGSITVNGNDCIYKGNNGVQTFAGSGLFDGWAIDFPVVSNSFWSSNGGTVKVISSLTGTSIAGNSYSNVYVLLRTTITPGGSVNDTLTIAPNVGIVKYNSFPLLSYHVQ